ncbi:MAG: hypothetical protein ACOWW1_07145 [archaeon]
MNTREKVDLIADIFAEWIGLNDILVPSDFEQKTQKTYKVSIEESI